jgi:hypothetical protein
MKRPTAGWRLGGALALVVLLIGLHSVEADQKKFSFTTFEGRIVAVGALAGEGEIELLSVDVATGSSPPKRVTVLLGPVDACREIGFEVDEGDEVRVRALVAGEGEPLKAQRILNLSRRVMVRFRTMRGLPLWNSAGAWQGSPGHAYHGGHHRARGGGGPGRGPGGF